MKIEATTCGSAIEAIQHAEIYGGKAAIINGYPCRIDDETAERLEYAGAEFAYLMPRDFGDGRARIVTVPVGG